MASRDFKQFRMSMEASPTDLWATIAFVAGTPIVPTLQQFPNAIAGYSAAGTAGWKGVLSVTRTAAGKFSLNLQDPYNRLLNFDYNWQPGGQTTQAAPYVEMVGDNSNAATQAILFNTASALPANTSNATDPTAGSILQIHICLSNSTAP